ncbi:uncharacterized protein N0V89_011455 [Didymosphaeria variabile]|uniref:SPT2-domain-containing protein n=1 Tax=Didymosphaeria variabile TaxID=1932322 RepID=A0A9W8XB64_9PLEO|nr:uncharacterized protein N0V89_011455 [Didymosphaeria variabile]KAJ4345325.1 hypothetical protein N0V89_011455 [Didymosphaeria variabile]
MNPLHDILSSIDPSKARIFSTTPPVQRLGTGSPKPATGAQRPPQRPAQPANGTSETSALKRKASNPGDVGQTKVPRKDAPIPLLPTNGARSGSAPAGARSTSTTPTTSMPYRGTAGLGTSKPANPQVKKPLAAGTVQTASAKITPSTSRPTAPRPAAAAPGASTAPVKKAGGYLAMLQKAKEKDATKPAAPPAKPEPTKIMSKKERDAARLAAKLGGKGKKPLVGPPGRVIDPKTSGAASAAQEKRKPADLGYQGTARPAPKKPADVGYKGTARPAAAASSAARPGTAAAAKKKPKPVQDRYAGYADWSDLDDMEDEEEEDYDSEGSSDMEAGMWDVEEENAKALKAAKQEDAEALAQENELKRIKEERKRKLAAMNKAAAGKRKF